ncbi:hypothetical protein [Streptomyces scabiei]|uniref:hypothetical protein n=1 Tax=Streptomyces scabiei TaxID=1930 RepID=UPI0029BAFB9C|nr:hypothetical protein [Streptomyces scabiei]MDX3523609.1 hypothetical protein [Streptomyces scabiei]
MTSSTPPDSGRLTYPYCYTDGHDHRLTRRVATEAQEAPWKSSTLSIRGQPIQGKP